MKKILFLVSLVWASMSALAQQLVLLPVDNVQQLEKVFQNQQIKPHFFNDELVIATAEKCASDMVLLDKTAFGDVECYYLVYCQQEAQGDYLKTQSLSVLYQTPHFLIVKAAKGGFRSAKNDGAIAIFNREARLPKMTRDFPVLTDENPDITYLLGMVNMDSLRATVQYMQDFGGRIYNSQAAFQTSEWIKSKFEAMGLEVELQAVTYGGQQCAPNVIAIQRGTNEAETFVVCGSHLDSYSFSGACPGADDNATGTASVLETARILSQYQFDKSIIYCTFTCEEMGLVGSAAYASRCASQGMDIAGYFNNDMNGYLYGDAIHIHQIYPSVAEPIGAYYRNVGAVYFPDMVIEHKNFSSGDSDHTSFNNNGYIGLYPFEDVNHYSPHIHTPGDTIGPSVNSFAMSQRYCQMNLACVAELAGMHARGPVVVTDFAVINDDNENGRVNPGETVTMSITMKNVFDEAINGVGVTMTSNSEYVEILDGQFDFGNFAAGEEKTVEGFRFRLSDEAPACVNYVFSLDAVGATASCVSTFKVMSYDYRLNAGNAVALDEDGMLFPGETTTLRFFVNNIGNESVIQLVSALTCESEYLTINGENTTEVSILPNMLGYFDYEVTLSAEASQDIVLPFVLTLQDVNGRETLVNYNFANSCNVVFALTDSYGDGWNGASIEVRFDDGTPTQTLTISSGSSQNYTFEIQTGVEVSLIWHAGQWDSECSYSVAYENGGVIFQGSGGENGTFFTWVNDCSGSGGNLPEMCGSVQNFTIDETTLLLTWEAPANGVPTAYEVYRGSDLIATTEDLSYQDDFEAAGFLTYCVYPVFADCQGEMICQTFYFDPDSVAEQATEAHVYPNPVKDQLTVVINAPVIVQIFNLQGQEVMRFRAEGQHSVDVSSLPSGIYTLKMIGKDVTTAKFVKD